MVMDGGSDSTSCVCWVAAEMHNTESCCDFCTKLTVKPKHFFHLFSHFVYYLAKNQNVGTYCHDYN